MQPDVSSPEKTPAWVRELLGEGHDLATIAVERRVVTAANRNAAAMFGRSPLGEPLSLLFDRGCWHKLDAALASSGACELQIATNRAEPRLARFVVLPCGNARRLLVAGSAAGAVGYSEAQGEQLLRLNDELAIRTRELSRTTHELARAHRRLEQLDALRRQFMAMLAHDLRSAFHAIGFIADALVRRPEDTSPERLAAAGKRLSRIVARLTRLVDTVLGAARLEDDEVRLATMPISLEVVAREAIDTLEPVADERRIALTCEVTGDPTAAADATWMGQVFSNVLANAIRHAPEGTCVRVAVLGQEGRVRCTVSDQGPGVPLALRSAIFERFRQAGPHAGHAGLGLYVASRAIELHGGRIWVEDVDGGGARFCFEVPRAAPRT